MSAAAAACTTCLCTPRLPSRACSLSLPLSLCHHTHTHIHTHTLSLSRLRPALPTSALCVQVRVEQVLMMSPPLLLAYQLGQLTSFYHGLISDILGPSAALSTTVAGCRDLADRRARERALCKPRACPAHLPCCCCCSLFTCPVPSSSPAPALPLHLPPPGCRTFMEQLKATGDRLLRSPPPPPADLSPPPQVRGNAMPARALGALVLVRSPMCHSASRRPSLAAPPAVTHTRAACHSHMHLLH